MAAQIAEIIVDSVDSKGISKKFKFAVNLPEQIDDVSWGCQLSMEGIISKPKVVVGEDA